MEGKSQAYIRAFPAILRSVLSPFIRAARLIEGAQSCQATPSGVGEWMRFSPEETEKTEDVSQLPHAQLRLRHPLR